MVVVVRFATNLLYRLNRLLPIVLFSDLFFSQNSFIRITRDFNLFLVIKTCLSCDRSSKG
ncbi:CLUMA_CG017061, isoform A [Clunio marinus]|uniref:CLUMA_CG017061, isoform A n=1 Tax=Clunio marinus TaxID=568069 RepID=A0A1J1IWJ5_9DIPT|nr:CLUMA_CG017061, isoform A [Clunio marinus]